MTHNSATGGIAQAQHEYVLETSGPAFYDISAAVADWLASASAGDGLLTLFIRHTSASLTIQENADPTVQADLMDALDRLAPRTLAYRHRTEGPDDMPAHVRAMLTATSLQVPVSRGRMLLGTWQAIYLVEHRDAPHARKTVFHFIGSMAER